MGAAGVGWFLKSRAQDTPLTVYFYSPETNVNNFALIKGEFDTFLADHGGHKFQPFSDRATFEQQVAANPRSLCLMSSWHCRLLAARQAMEPLLVGRARGKSTQKHLLFGRTKNPADLRGQKVASGGTREFTLTLLLQILPGQQALVDSLKILVVPKDIDALMAVGFGAAKGAVATESGSDKLAKSNPKQRGELQQLGGGYESLLPVLAGPKNTDDSMKKLAAIFRRMGDTGEGRSRLQLLGLEALTELDATQKGRLKS